jgi:hypothetical protein
MSRVRTLLTAALMAGAAVCLSASAQAQCAPNNFPANWLQQQDNAGGHTIARHVNQSDQLLTTRLANFPHIPAAGSYPALVATAQATITAGLTSNAGAINNWANHAANGARQVYDYASAANIGRVATRNAPPPPAAIVSNTCTFRVVLHALGGGACYLLTSYPTPAAPADNCP